MSEQVYRHQGWAGVAEYDPLRMRLALRIVREFHGVDDRQAKHVTSLGPDGPDLTDWQPQGAEAPVSVAVEEPVARLLWELLNDHFGGPGPSRELRKDYDAERARVDKLIELVALTSHSPRYSVGAS